MRNTPIHPCKVLPTDAYACCGEEQMAGEKGDMKSLRDRKRRHPLLEIKQGDGDIQQRAQIKDARTKRSH